MITETTVGSLAKLLIEKHGVEASDIAAERSRVLRDCNDRQSSRTWFLISQRIDQIAPSLPIRDSFPWLEQADDMPSDPAEVDGEPALGGERVEVPELVD